MPIVSECRTDTQSKGRLQGVGPELERDDLCVGRDGQQVCVQATEIHSFSSKGVFQLPGLVHLCRVSAP